MKSSVSAWVPARWGAIPLLYFLAAGVALPQQALDSNFRMTGAGVLDVFEPQRQVIQESSVVIYEGRSQLAYGTIVSEDGYILSKASELAGKGELDVRVGTSIYKDVVVLLEDPVWDVALLKVDGTGLKPVEYAQDSNPAQGTWVVVNGATSRTRRRVLAGIISAESREIEAEGGAVLGVLLKEGKGSLKIGEVTEGSGAQEAGLKSEDVITAVDGKQVKEAQELTELLALKKAGQNVLVSIERGKAEMEVSVRLSARGELFKQMSRNDEMSGDFSKRRSGFPKVIQHDVLANSNTMGGPVIGLDGQLLGMNIARANRAETFAIPAAELRQIADEMISRAKK